MYNQGSVMVLQNLDQAKPLSHAAAMWVELQAVTKVGLGTASRLWLMAVFDRLSVLSVPIYDKDINAFNGLIQGRMYHGLTGLSLGYGLGSALSTFASQNHGANESYKNGVVFHAYVKLLSVIFCVACVFAYYSDTILRFLNYSSESLRAPIVLVVQISLFQLWFQWLQFGLNAMLDSQRRPWLTLVVQVCAGMAVVAASFGLMSYGWNWITVVWIRVISTAMIFTFVVCIISANKLPGMVWEGNGQPAFSVLEYTRVAFPSALVMWLEWWGSEAMSILCASLPNESISLSAHGILFLEFSVCTPFFVGIAIGACTRVGNLIGEGRPQVVYHTIVASVMYSLISALVISSFLYFHMHTIINISTQVDIVRNTSATAWPGMLVSIVAYSVAITMAGVFRGAGLQFRSALACSFGVWICGIPCAYFYGVYLNHGLVWIWYGNAFGLFVASLIMLFDSIVGVDWIEIARLRTDQKSK